MKHWHRLFISWELWITSVTHIVSLRVALGQTQAAVRCHAGVTVVSVAVTLTSGKEKKTCEDLQLQSESLIEKKEVYGKLIHNYCPSNSRSAMRSSVYPLTYCSFFHSLQVGALLCLRSSNSLIHCRASETGDEKNCHQLTHPSKPHVQQWVQQVCRQQKKVWAWGLSPGCQMDQRPLLGATETFLTIYLLICSFII